jgi:hypothetical protein
MGKGKKLSPLKRTRPTISRDWSEENKNSNPAPQSKKDSICLPGCFFYHLKA